MDEIKLILDNANKCRDINDFENALNFYKKQLNYLQIILKFCMKLQR